MSMLSASAHTAKHLLQQLTSILILTAFLYQSQRTDITLSILYFIQYIMWWVHLSSISPT